MPRHPGFLALAAAAALTLAGCSFETFTYSIDRYGTVKARQVRLSCHDAYEVFDRPDAGQLLVTTNALTEAIAGCGDAALPRAERLRRIAGIFLSETTDRPQCRIVRETPLADWQTEFGYRCDLPEAPRRKVGLRR